MKLSLLVALLALFSPHCTHSTVASFEWACYTENAFQDLRSTFDSCMQSGIDLGGLTVDQLDELKFQAEMGEPSTALTGFMDWTNEFSLNQECLPFSPSGNPNPADKQVY